MNGADVVVPTPDGPLNADATDTVEITDLFGGTTDFTASVNAPAVFTTNDDATSGVQVAVDEDGNEFIFLQPTNAPSNGIILAPTFDINNPGPSAQYEFTFDDPTNAEFTIGGINNADTVRIFGFLEGVLVPLDASNVVINDADLSLVGGITDGSVAVTSPDMSDGGILVDTNDATFTIEGVDQIIVVAAKNNDFGSTVTLGITNIAVESIDGVDTDSDGTPDFLDTDSDNDGIGDSLESTNDTDSDGILDFRDTDSDSDGIADSLESTIDTDLDGTPDFLDTDSDSDGIADSLESTVDTDLDGTLDFRETDSDSDGIADSLESTIDTDSDLSLIHI